MPVLVGTSGWQYRDWRGRFYPPGLPEQAWLEYDAAAFATVESNSRTRTSTSTTTRVFEIPIRRAGA